MLQAPIVLVCNDEHKERDKCVQPEQQCPL